jgi:oligopeptide transport system permease protein
VGKYALLRMAQAPLVLLILITVSFFLMRLAPGGPFDGERKLDPVAEQALRARYHLDESLPRQYARFLVDCLCLDLGPSTKHHARTVNEIIGATLPVSLVLGALALVVALIGGLAAGIVSAARHNSWLDYGAMTFAMLGLSLPPFVIGPLLALLFGLYLGWLPTAGYDGLTGISHLILPALTLGLPFAARIARLMRAGMLEVIHQDFIRTARAKGLSEFAVITRHAVRGGICPVISFLGPAVAFLLTGSLVVEQIFQIPGLGREFVESALNRDYTLVMGTVIVYGAILIASNLIADLIHAVIDPRVRLT